jgi:hypothetical protein
MSEGATAMTQPAFATIEKGGGAAPKKGLRANDSIEMAKDLFERLVKSKVYTEVSPEAKAALENSEVKTVTLDSSQLEQFENGLTFGLYLIVLKDRMVRAGFEC